MSKAVEGVSSHLSTEKNTKKSASVKKTDQVNAPLRRTVPIRNKKEINKTEVSDSESYDNEDSLSSEEGEEFSESGSEPNEAVADLPMKPDSNKNSTNSSVKFNKV